MDLSNPKLIATVLVARVDFMTRWGFLDPQFTRSARAGPFKIARSAMRVACSIWELPFGCQANNAEVTLKKTTNVR